VENKAKSFAISRLNKYIKPAVYAKVEWHREHHHTLVLVSANLAIYLRYWANLHKLDYVIATEIDFDVNNYVSGKLATRNCYGAEKVSRIEQFLSNEKLQFCYSYGYGNSAGDKEMLGHVDEAYYVSGEYMKRCGVSQ
jgi:phosphatidylglycerophosphatase C